ncbi:MAG TPA: hypothetical protein DHW49_11110, partial [Anaerolineae bacterium]|nr:hypothetical protein [Anaerolineae bacterium]
MPKFIIQPYDKVRVGDLLIDGLQSNKWKEFHAVVAFVKRSGMKHIIKPLSKFSRRGRILICVGIDQDGTTIEGLQMLLDAAGKNSELYIFHNRNNSTF